MTEVARRLHTKKTTLHYHVASLEASGALASRRVGRYRILVPDAGAPDVDALAAPGRRRVAEAVVARPGVHQAEVARAVGLARSTVHHHVAALVAAGLIRVDHGVVARCWPTPALERALARASTSWPPPGMPGPCPRSPPSR